MCDICGYFFCVPRCPSYAGQHTLYGRSVGVCAVCGERIYEREDFYADGSRMFCADCLSSAKTLKAGKNQE